MLLEAFKARTGCPVVVNTSFNVRGEPIVCTPADAFRCFMGTDVDCLAVGNCFLRKEAQNPLLKRDDVVRSSWIDGQGNGREAGTPGVYPPVKTTATNRKPRARRLRWRRRPAVGNTTYRGKPGPRGDTDQDCR